MAALHEKNEPKIPATFSAKGRGSEQIAQSLNEILTASNIMGLATVNGDVAYNCVVLFAYDEDLTLYFLSEPKTEHVHNLLKNDQVAVAIAHTDQSWDRPRRGLQIRGRAVRPTGDDLVRATRIYFERWPGMRRTKYETGSGDKKDLHIHVFAIKPTFCKIFDEKIFGHEVWVELELPSV